jgi:N-dimethylarginine dimethylaminohydrolase
MKSCHKNKILNLKDIDFELTDIPSRPEPMNVLTCEPKYFRIVDVKNPYMEKNVGLSNTKEAIKQWNAIKNIYKKWVEEGILDEYSELEPVEGLEDMVFTANHGIPWVLKNGEKIFVPSNMKYESRKKEIPYAIKFFESKGYRIAKISEGKIFEGNGDLIAHPTKRLVYVGYGQRTSMDSLEEIAQLLETPVIPLKLINPHFYHLDTCFHPLNVKTVMICPEAFDFESFQLIKKIFPKVIRISTEENKTFFALNSVTFHRQFKKVAMIHYGSTNAYRLLLEEAYHVEEVDTSEFIKSGGSIFCMKLMYY